MSTLFNGVKSVSSQPRPDYIPLPLSSVSNKSMSVECLCCLDAMNHPNGENRAHFQTLSCPGRHSWYWTQLLLHKEDVIVRLSVSDSIIGKRISDTVRQSDQQLV